MRNLFEREATQEIRERVTRLRPDQAHKWGTMNAPQALAHLSASMEMALGIRRPPRKLVSRVLGPIIKRFALGNDEPMRRNSPTMPELVVADDRDFAKEREKLLTLIDRFTNGGPAICSTYPHSFFGHLTPEQWSILMYKHLDHHLRQFGV